MSNQRKKPTGPEDTEYQNSVVCPGCGIERCRGYEYGVVYVTEISVITIYKHLRTAIP